MFTKILDSTPNNVLSRKTVGNLNCNPLDFFPYPEIRPQQKRAIEEIHSAFQKGKRIIVLEGPCGSGKSAIINTFTRMFKTAHVITPLKLLQSQYMSDFPGEMADVRGKSNYECCLDRERKSQVRSFTGEPERIKNCSNGPCSKPKFDKKANEKTCVLNHKILNDTVSFFDGHTTSDDHGNAIQFFGCEYQVAKAIARLSPTAVHNFDSFLYQNMNQSSQWDIRPLLAVDEAHNIESKLINFMSVSVSEEHLLPGDFLDCSISNGEEFCKFFCQDKPYSYFDMYQYFDNDDVYFQKSGESDSSERFTRARFLYAKCKYFQAKGDEKEARIASESFERIQRIWGHIEYAKANNLESDFFFEILEIPNKSPILKGSPLYAGFFIKKIIEYGQRIILASATILNFELYCNSIGINPKDAVFIRLESEFPKETRILKKRFVGKMNYRNKEVTLPKLVNEINFILSEHSNEKGVIHSHTVANSKFIYDELYRKYRHRLLIRDNFGWNKDEMINHHINSPDPTVIIDPGCEGT